MLLSVTLHERVFVCVLDTKAVDQCIGLGGWPHSRTQFKVFCVSSHGHVCRESALWVKLPCVTFSVCVQTKAMFGKHIEPNMTVISGERLENLADDSCQFDITFKPWRQMVREQTGVIAALRGVIIHLRRSGFFWFCCFSPLRQSLTNTYKCC